MDFKWDLFLIQTTNVISNVISLRYLTQLTFPLRSQALASELLEEQILAVRCCQCLLWHAGGWNSSIPPIKHPLETMVETMG